MPELSNRAHVMPASPIRKLTPYANEAVERGINVLHLNIGQPDIETPAQILEAVRHSDFKILSYSPSAGIESYRRALAGYYGRKGIQVQPDEIMVTVGGSEAIQLAMMSCLNPGDEIIIPEPFYANYNGYAVETGVHVVPVTAKIEDNFALPPISSFEELITPRTKAIMICNPNNPTGYLYSQREVETLKDICLKHDLFLFSDEAYREFCYDGASHFSAMNLKGLEEHVVLLDTVSKRYSSCGARIGALVTRNKTVAAAVLNFEQARLSPPTFGQILGEAACGLPEDYFDVVLEEYQNRRNTLVDRLQKIPGVFCPKPKGAFYVMARLPVKNSEDFCKWLLESFSYKEETVMLAPASGFYASGNLGGNEVRMAYVINEEKINRAMDCLEKALETYPGKIN